MFRAYLVFNGSENPRSKSRGHTNNLIRFHLPIRTYFIWMAQDQISKLGSAVYLRVLYIRKSIHLRNTVGFLRQNWWLCMMPNQFSLDPELVMLRSNTPESERACRKGHSPLTFAIEEQFGHGALYFYTNCKAVFHYRC